MKVKIVHYLHFQLNWGKYQEEENTLIESTLTINLRATAKPKTHCFSGASARKARQRSTMDKKNW